MISRSLQEKEEGPGVEEAKASDMAEEHAEKYVNYENASDERDSVDSEALSSEEEKEMSSNDKFEALRRRRDLTY